MATGPTAGAGFANPDADVGTIPVLGWPGDQLKAVKLLAGWIFPAHTRFIRFWFR